ncbi:uncharacterized protein LOC110100872 [Dendrobium catenatum]|uniref:RNase H type-1 domain-containing protein n=1 Tax=Dendrobium catenatum TaxID=906689 RepID=A0A2I0VYG2_9ASPA|nr:uncharacterized protein LOC110100872 [Dendrobium catenatum]PKU68455.1 hypothetical protein MA16_Dca016813 [Dendrobium catenatum]
MSNKSCTVEFDGACKGNPGKGGAGAVIRNARGDVVARVNKPLGFTTNNVAEYEGLIVGIEKATEMGYKEIHARGDSQLVCKQVDGSWKVGSSNLFEPSRRVNDLVGGLDEFDISHVPREYNTEADQEANKAAYG